MNKYERYWIKPESMRLCNMQLQTCPITTPSYFLQQMNCRDSRRSSWVQRHYADDRPTKQHVIADWPVVVVVIISRQVCAIANNCKLIFWFLSSCDTNCDAPLCYPTLHCCRRSNYRRLLGRSDLDMCSYSSASSRSAGNWKTKWELRMTFNGSAQNAAAIASKEIYNLCVQIMASERESKSKESEISPRKKRQAGSQHMKW